MSNWREVGMYVKGRGQGSSLQKWTVQVWETEAPMNPARRIVAAEFRYECGGEVQEIYRLTSQDMTVVEAVQFAAALFNVPITWADLTQKEADEGMGLLTLALEEVDDDLPGGFSFYTLAPA